MFYFYVMLLNTIPNYYNIISFLKSKQFVVILMRHQYSSSNENGREEAKLATNTQQYTFSKQNFTSFNSVG